MIPPKLVQAAALRKFLEKLASKDAAHKKNLGKFSKSGAEFMERVPDPDPTAIAGDVVDQVSPLGRWLQRSKGAKTRARNEYDRASSEFGEGADDAVEDLMEEIEKRGQFLRF